MFLFIVTSVLMVSLGMILYLFIRAIPRVGEDELQPKNRPVLERWITSEMPERIDAVASTYIGKLFRKLKVYLLRLDNYLTARLKTLHTGEGNGVGLTGGPAKPKVDFSGLGSLPDRQAGASSGKETQSGGSSEEKTK